MYYEIKISTLIHKYVFKIIHEKLFSIKNKIIIIKYTFIYLKTNHKKNWSF